jgi:hypothetical protein
MPGRLRLFRARGRAFPPERRAKRGARQQGVRAIDRRQHMTREARLFDEQPAVARDDVCDAIHQRGDQGREPPGLRHDIDIEQHDRLVGRVDAAQGCQLILALLRGRLRPAGEHDLAVEGAGPERRVRASKAGSSAGSGAASSRSRLGTWPVMGRITVVGATRCDRGFCSFRAKMRVASRARRETRSPRRQARCDESAHTFAAPAPAWPQARHGRPDVAREHPLTMARKARPGDGAQPRPSPTEALRGRGPTGRVRKGAGRAQ